MALSYDHLFSDIGEMIEAVDDIYTLAATTLPAMADEIEDELTDETDKGDGLTPAARYDILSGIPEMFSRFQDAAIGWIDGLAGKVEESLLDLDILGEADLPVDRYVGVQDMLAELYRKMIDDSETVDASTVQIAGADQNSATATADGNNLGGGKVFCTRILDGYSSPISGGQSMREYAYDRANALWPGDGAGYVGEESQLAVASETMTLTCTADSETDGLSEGGESFEMIGGITGKSDYDWETEGSGRGPSISVMNQSGLVTDGEFENWTAQNGNYHPANWDVDSGTTQIDQTTDRIGGDYALQFTGDGALATIQISQDASASLIPLKRYCVACWVEHLQAAAGLLTIQFEGTGYTAPTTEKISIDLTAAAQDPYAEEYFFITMPAEIPSDFELVIKVTGTLSDTKTVKIDRLAIGEVTWHGGLGWAILAGSNLASACPFIRGDRFTCTITNNDNTAAGGTFQRFFRKHFKMQLPSNSAGAETIDDAWAE